MQIVHAVPLLRTGLADQIPHLFTGFNAVAKYLVDMPAGTASILGERLAPKALDIAQLRTEDMQDEGSHGGFLVTLQRHFEQVFSVRSKPLLPALALVAGVPEQFFNREMHLLLY